MFANGLNFAVCHSGCPNMPDIIPPAQLKRRAFSAHCIQCSYLGCKRWLKSVSGLKVHQNLAHSHSFTRSAQLSCTQCASVEEIQDEGDTPRRTNTDVVLQELKSGLIHDYHDFLTGKYMVLLPFQLVFDENLCQQVVFVMRTAIFLILALLLHPTQHKVLMTGLHIATD
jgi:hypothetical protein